VATWSLPMPTRNWWRWVQIPRVRSTEGDPGFIPSYRHQAGDYLGAALPVGLQVRRCEEPRQQGRDENAVMAQPIEVGPWDGWPWSLHGIVPAAAGAVWAGMPALIIWHFQLALLGTFAPVPEGRG
jgi:hypothetical protein